MAVRTERERDMATNKPTGDNARKGAVRKRSQTKTTMGDATTWTKRDQSTGEFMAVKKAKKEVSATKQSAPKKAAAAKKKTAKKTTVAKKHKGVRREKK